MKKIFVGGYGGIGSRVFQKILQDAGYFLGKCNEYLDWVGAPKLYVPSVSTRAFRSGNNEPIKTMVDLAVEGQTSWSLKHGHLMFNFQALKEFYPDCVCVLTVRHPLDTVTNEYDMHTTHGGLPLDACVSDKLDFYGKAHAEALKYTDFVFRLEDAVYKTEETVRSILDFAEVDQPVGVTSWIYEPATIGRAKEHYPQYKTHHIVRALGY